MRVLTAAEAEVGAQATTGWLRQRGIGAGERVAIAYTKPTGPNDAAAQVQAETLQVVYGCLRNAVTPVMVNPQLSQADQDYVRRDCQPSAILESADYAAVLRTLPVAVGPHLLARPMHYTSGTTGVAKGVWAGGLEPDLIVAWWADEAQAWPFDAADTTLISGPLVHSAPLRFPLLTLAAGGNVIAPGAFDAAVAARAITEHRPSTAFMVPTHLQRILALADVPTSRFRLLAHAGAACPAPLKTRAHEWAGVANVWEFYGATEGQFTQCHGPDWIGRTGTLGRARRGRTLFTDEGVIWCVAPVSAKFEYWNDPAKTAAAWRVLPDGSEAFSVGDLGHLDDDGYLYFDGRRSDLIISGGVNVYPAHLEEVLTGVPGVDECAVFGLDDSHWGQIVCVAYVGRVSAEDVIATARAQLAAYQVPKRAFRLAELPRNANGKLIRSDLPAMIGLT